MLADRDCLLAMPQQIRLSLASDVDAVRDGLRHAFSVPPLAGLTDDDRSTAEIVLAEVLNNVVEHAYAKANGEIRLHLSVADNRLHCIVEDDGCPMPGGEPPAGSLPDSVELPEGGFGWHLIRSLSSGLSYDRRGQTNRLTFSLPAELSNS